MDINDNANILVFSLNFDLRQHSTSLSSFFRLDSKHDDIKGRPNQTNRYYKDSLASYLVLGLWPKVEERCQVVEVLVELKGLRVRK